MVKSQTYLSNINSAFKELNEKEYASVRCLQEVVANLRGLSPSDRRFRYFFKKALSKLIEERDYIILKKRVRPTIRFYRRFIAKTVSTTRRRTYKKPLVKKTKSQLARRRNAVNNAIPLTLTQGENISKAIWQYYDASKHGASKRSDHFYDYDPAASDIVEAEWRKYVNNRAMNDVRAVKSGEWEYFVDFINWTQTNVKHAAHTKRAIRRLDEFGRVTKNPYL